MKTTVLFVHNDTIEGSQVVKNITIFYQPQLKGPEYTLSAVSHDRKWAIATRKPS